MMKLLAFLWLLFFGFVVAGCNFYPKETNRGKPLRLLKDNPNDVTIDDKTKAKLRKKQQEKQKGAQAPQSEMECTVENTQRPIRLLNRGFEGFSILASCPTAEDGKTSSQRVYVLQDSAEDLYSIGKGTKISAIRDRRDGERFLRYTGTQSGSVQQRLLPGGVDDFNEVMIGMPGGEGMEFTCLPSDRMKKMSIGKHRLLRSHVGDDVHDTYWYVECAGRTWPAEGLLLFFNSADEVVTPRANRSFTVEITGYFGTESYLTGKAVL